MTDDRALAAHAHGVFLAQQVGRFVLNVVLTYVLAGGTIFAGVLAATAIDPRGGAGVASSLVDAWVVALVVFPIVLLSIGALDLLLRVTPWPQRRTAVAYSLVPGLFMLFPFLAAPTVLLPIVAWLWAMALLFGGLMRLPPRRVQD